jgi:hypothetical protein
MVIGGQAVLLHGRPRFTGDIDITLGVDVERFESLREISEKLSLKPIIKNAERFARETGVFPVRDAGSKIKVDFIFSFAEYERQAIARARRVAIGKTKVCYASAEDTIIYKIVAGRPIDLDDVKSIVNLRSGIDRAYVRKWLKVYTEVVGRDLLADYREIERRVSKSRRK